MITTGVSSARYARAIVSQTFHVDDYGADSTGTLDSTAAFVSAYAAAMTYVNGLASAGASGGADILFGEGVYKLTAGSLTASDPRVGVIGPGSGACLIQVSGSGDAFYHYSANFATYHRGRTIGGFTIDGTNTTGAAAGLHVADMGGVKYNDLVVQNFTQAGSYGVKLSTISGWSEDLQSERIFIFNCTTLLAFIGAGVTTNGSFDYSNHDFYLNISPGQTGLSVTNFAQLLGCRLRLRFNAQINNSGLTSTLLRVGTNGSDSAQILDTEMAIMGEADGSGSSNIQDIVVGGGSTLLDMHGVFSTQGGNWIAGNVIGSNAYVRLAGYLDSLPTITGGSGYQATKTNSALQTFSVAPTLDSPSWMRGLRLQDMSGNTRTTIMSGSGAPSNPSGVSAGPTAGDLYFRTDTPSTANQRIYICTVGGGTPTWVGIV